MQARQSQSGAGTGRISTGPDDIHYDSAAADIVGLPPEEGSLSTEEFARLGPDAIATFGSASGKAKVSLGLWLTELLTGSRDASIYARCSTTGSLVIEAIAHKGHLQLRANPHFAALRLKRHEQRNLVNAMQMNAELAKMLAQKEGQERIGGIIEKILQECQRFEFDAQDLAAEPDSPDYELSQTEAIELLEGALQGRLADPEQADVVIAVSHQCPRPLLIYCHQLAVGLPGAGDKPLSVAITASDSLLLTVSAPRSRLAANLPEALAPGAATLLQSVQRSPSSPGHLPIAIPAYYSAANGEYLRLQFQVADTT